MTNDLLRIVKTGLGISLQDTGRRGFRRFGVPPGGPMDPHAAALANRLVANPKSAPVLEILMQGAEFAVLQDCRLALTGANSGSNLPLWEARDVAAGTTIRFPRAGTGIWSYLAVPGGWKGDRIFGSVSAFPRAGIGRVLHPGDLLSADGRPAPGISKTAGSWLWWGEERDYSAPPLIRLWRGPQWDEFAPEERRCVVGTPWLVSSRSDRTGYRLEGARINAPTIERRSEPVVVGSVQVPPNGQPIVTMVDGPTVGGYPKIGVVDPSSLPWLAQCCPGTKFEFAPVDF